MIDQLTLLQRKILDAIQQDFPLCHSPYAEIASMVNCSESEAFEAVQSLRSAGVIRRIGGSFVPASLGYVSALVAARVEPSQLEAAAACASSFAEVTHNYERKGEYNLWFTIIAQTQERLKEIADEVRKVDGVSSLHDLPATQTFKLRVQFNMEQQNDR